MEKHPVNVTTASAHQHGLIWQFPGVRNGRRLVLLHGAGIAGELTWTYVVNYLSEWQEVLVPDLMGMGQSRAKSDADCGVSDYADQIGELLDALDWHNTDIAGYSFGGLVTRELLDRGRAFALCYLLEPAFLSGDDAAELLAKADCYRTIATELQQSPRETAPLLAFLDAVSPNRRQQAASDRIAISRLKANLSGLIQALNAVADYLESHTTECLDWVAPVSGMGLSGQASAPGLQSRQQRLEQESVDWYAQVIAGADHSMVFTHPKQVARLMNERCRALADIG